MYNEIDGDLITLALEGKFDVITHGCNCMCRMGAGIAPKMAKAFGCDKYSLEQDKFIGNIQKLGQVEHQSITVGDKTIYVVNSYTQFLYDSKTKPLDYEALTLCLRKINHMFKGMHVGLPKIGSGLAGGDWNIVKQIIQVELHLCDVTIVNYEPI